ncbi:T9SS type A sorting domain-containing protein, partial [Raoultella planticola]|uniref:T9SS type A sorting domain-containing protein n=1 Tax=Raoultella planticola TaxID=575 RepID=UPI003A4C56BB
NGLTTHAGSAASASSINFCWTTVTGLSTVKENKNNNISFYPNPTEGKSFVRFNSRSMSPYHIEVMDVTGRMIMEKEGTTVTGENSIELNCVDLA